MSNILSNNNHFFHVNGNVFEVKGNASYTEATLGVGDIQRDVYVDPVTANGRYFVCRSSSIQVRGLTDNALITTISTTNATRGIVYDPTNARFLVTFLNNNTVETMHPATFARTVAVSLGGGTLSPGYIALDTDNNRFFLGEWGNDRIGVYNLTTFANIAYIPNIGAMGVVYDQTTNQILCSDIKTTTNGYRIFVYDADTFTLKTTITGAGKVYGMRIDPNPLNNRILGASSDLDCLVAINRTSLTYTKIPITMDNVQGVDVHPDKRIFAARATGNTMSIITENFS
jgi:hypothetical protein